MTKEVLTVRTENMELTKAPRTQKLSQFFRAVSLFSTPLRSAKMGLRRRK